MPEQVRERVIESYIADEAKRLGCITYKFTSPSFRGVPDRIIIGYGHTVFCEVKRPKEVPRPSQTTCIESMRAHGAKVFIIDTTSKADAMLKQVVDVSLAQSDINDLSCSVPLTKRPAIIN